MFMPGFASQHYKSSRGVLTPSGDGGKYDKNRYSFLLRGTESLSAHMSKKRPINNHTYKRDYRSSRDESEQDPV